MKNKSLGILVLAVLSVFNSHFSILHAQGTTFTYQGRLNIGGLPYTGDATFVPTLWDDATAGTLVAGNSPSGSTVAVTNGLFVLSLNFGIHFPGAGRWLQLEVSTNGSPATILAPRQQITATPYAITAGNLSGPLPATQLTGTITNSALPVSPIFSGTVAAASFVGNGSGVSNVNAASLGGLVSSNFWQTGGNNVATGQFLGSTNNQPLELRVNNQRGLRLETGASNSVNVIGGWGGNSVAAGIVGATVAGGGAGMDVLGTPGNRVEADFGSIGGGDFNTIQSNAVESTIGGGCLNTIQTDAYDSTISGGYINLIETHAPYSTIGGGHYNTILPNSFNVTIGGGSHNYIQSLSSYSTIGGGYFNNIQPSAVESTIGGGGLNTIQTNASSSTIGGGRSNTIFAAAAYATIPGGQNNAATNYAFAAGRRAKANHTGAFVWADSTDADFASTAANQFRVRASGGMQVVGGTAQPALNFTGARTGGLSTPVGLAENTQASGQSAPALRVVNYGGDAIDGALSVSANGIGYIATFGNASSNVSRLTTNGTWTALAFNPASDRNAKENFNSIDPSEVLAKVSALSLERWNYKAAPGVEHIGPVAQDFHAAFGLNGEDDKHIATVDADGVALAAIQGLNQKVDKLEAELSRRDAENATLRHRLEKLESLFIGK